MPQTSPIEILRRTFGYQEFRHQQAEIIATLLAGRDAMVLMPTGGGKSLCYQIPALIRTGVGVVISPLIALMKDQVDALQQFGVRAAFINSSLAARACWNTEQAMVQGKLDLVYIAPERLLSERMLNLLKQTDIALFAIDEAHCVAQWGHDFRKEYQQLFILHQQFPGIPRLALTATADARTRQEIIQQLNLAQARVFIHSFDRPNIRYQISEAIGSTKSRLWNFLHQNHPQNAGIVYCLSRKMVEDVATWLRSKGREALPYHAGLADEVRKYHQERFLREDGIIIVATIAFGMGIDKPDVRFVAHLNLPKSIEAYYQETGRAGRDGLPADAWMAYGLQDIITLRNMVNNGEAEDFFKRVAIQKLDAMLGLCELASCRRQYLLSYFGETLAKPCGNCDNCVDPPETWDATVTAQKALSCVYRTGQRFGVAYLTEVLRGSTDDERIVRNKHNKISTFGIGKDVDPKDWSFIFRQLVARGYVETDSEHYGGLRLTKNARLVFTGEVPIHLRRRSTKTGQGKGEPMRSKDGIRPQDAALADALRVLRKQLAHEQGVAPFVIFHDTTLMDLLLSRPQNLNQLLRVIGLGERKVAKYGQALLDCIAAHPTAAILHNQLSDTVNATLTLIAQGQTPAAIAIERKLKISTIYNHIAEAIAANLLNAREILPIQDEEYAAIIKMMRDLDFCNKLTFKPLYESLEQRYDYGILRCIAAAECGKI